MDPPRPRRRGAAGSTGRIRISSHSHPRASRVNISWPCSRGGRSPGSIGCGSSDIFVRLPGPESQRFCAIVNVLPFYRGQNFMSRWFWSSGVSSGREFLSVDCSTHRAGAVLRHEKIKGPKNQLENVPSCNAMACPAGGCNRLTNGALMCPTRICILHYLFDPVK